MKNSTKRSADAQADLSLRWAHTHFVGFVMSWLTYIVMHGDFSYKEINWDS